MMVISIMSTLFIPLLSGVVACLPSHSIFTLCRGAIVASFTVAALAMPCAAQTSLQAAPNMPVATIELGQKINDVPIDLASQYWVDDTSSITVEQLDAKQANVPMFMPRQFAQIHAVHGKVLWLRFQTRITDPQSQWFVELSSALTDNVTLYWRNSNNTWSHQRAGDAVPRAQWPVQGRFSTFRLAQDINQPATYYVRIEQNRTPFSEPLHIYRDTSLVSQRQKEHLYLGAYFGLALMVALACIAMAAALRDNDFLHYLFYVIAIGMSQASYTGLAAQYLWPNSPVWSNTASFFLYGMAAVAGLWFVRNTLKPQLRMPRLDRAIVWLMLAQTANMGLELLVPSLWGFYALIALTLAIFVAVYGVAWFAWTRGSVSGRWVALGFLPVVLSVIPLMLRSMGWLQSNFFTQYGATLGSALEMTLLLYALSLRAGARSESLARAAGLPTQDPLTGLSNTRDLLRHIQGALTRANRYNQQYALVLIELDNYDWFIKEHGPAIGNTALILMSTRVQLIARDVDTAGRLDDNQFVLVVEGPCKPSYVAKIAAQISASGHRPSDLLPVGASLKLRVTCALMPDPEALALGDDAKAQLGWLLTRSETDDDNSHKLLRTLNF
jgi:two-component system, sensor histidine kinase LadS